MDTDEQKIKQIYYGITTKHYNPPISHFFEKYKKMVFNESSEAGDNVRIF